MSTAREAKKQIQGLMAAQDWPAAFRQIMALPAKPAINALLSAIKTPQPEKRERAVAALGAAVDRLAAVDLEQAREIMRRLVWSMNDESGGIGWGAAEAMGEIMALNADLAQEFANILGSYVREGRCQLEFTPLLHGALAGILRLAQARPDVARGMDMAASLPGLCADGDSATAELVAAVQLALAG